MGRKGDQASCGMGTMLSHLMVLKREKAKQRIIAP